MAFYTGDGSNNRFTGGSGDDIAHGLGGDDTLNGGAGGNDKLYGGDGNDSLYGGGPGGDILYGEADNDTLVASFGLNDELYGGDGADSLQINVAANSESGDATALLDGGDGNDTISMNTTSLPAQLLSVTITGGAGNDGVTLAGNIAGSIDLGDGADTITLARALAMTLTLGPGADKVAFTSIIPASVITITDFAPGAAGDTLDLPSLGTNGDLLGWHTDNPFNGGFLRLVQQGADTYLQVDRDGASGSAYQWASLAIFQNTQASAFAAYNLDGFPPDGSPPPAVLTGTSAGDVLQGGAGDDVINGNGGADVLHGGGGADQIFGGDGDDDLYGDLGGDKLFGGLGDDRLSSLIGLSDQLYGGDGNDNLSLDTDPGSEAGSPSALLDGGDGDDHLYINNTTGITVTATVTGGAGNDQVAVNGQVVAAVDLGAGNDEFFSDRGGHTVTLGSGVDTFWIDRLSGSASTITDFTTGLGGDVVRFYDNGSTAGLSGDLVGWISDNPFKGFLRLVQQGADTLLQVDRDGLGAGAYGWSTLVVFQNTQATAFTAENFSGYPPNGSSPIALALNGTAGADSLRGGMGADTIHGLDGADNIYGGNNADTLYGDGGNDWVSGDYGDDVVYGGDGDDGLQGDLGFDVLYGGAGNDTLYTQDGGGVAYGGDGDDKLYGSTFKDHSLFYGGAGNDTIVGSDTGLDVAAFGIDSTAATISHNANGSWTVTADADGTDTLSNVAVLRFTDRDIVIRQPAPSDFNADGKSDVLWRNDSGELYVWNSQSGQGAFLGQTLGNVGNSWHVQAVGDYDGDGKADVLWRNNTGDLYVYRSDDGAAVTFTGQSITYVDPVWAIVPHAGDFDGDGRSDILYRNSATGEVYLWNSNTGADVSFVGQSLGGIPANWHIQGVDDFDADGKADVFWRNDAGDVYVWLSRGGDNAVTTQGQTISSVPTDWSIIGAGDFNGDGRADILWRHAGDGELYVWNSQTNSAAINFLGQSLGVVGLDWSVAAIGDYDGDGRADILFRNADGRVYLWNSTDTGAVGFTGQGLGTTPTDWHVLSDFHGM